MAIADEKLIGIGAASALLGVHPDTLREWEKNGQIKSFRTKGNHRRFRVGDLRLAEKDSAKWNRFVELARKYRAVVDLIQIKAINEWLYFFEDHDPDFCSFMKSARRAHANISEEHLYKYILISILRSNWIDEYNSLPGDPC